MNEPHWTYANYAKYGRPTDALIARLRKTGDLVIGSTDDEQRARYEREHGVSEEAFACRSAALHRWFVRIAADVRRELGQ